VKQEKHQVEEQGIFVVVTKREGKENGAKSGRK
jgi:hypothetical protein